MMRDYASLAKKVVARSSNSRNRLAIIHREARGKSEALYQESQGLKEVGKQRAEVGRVVDLGIEGFFPTPRELADRMVRLADIRAGMTVLEPEAGAGHIADAIPKSCSLTLIESNWTLCELLRKKGYVVIYADFLEWQQSEPFDRIVMNPPFEFMQDIDHIKRAFDLLALGGRLVAIASAATQHNSKKKAVEFRAWLEEVGADIEPLPLDSFKQSDRPTGVQTCLTVIDK